MAKCPGCDVEVVKIGENKVQCPSCELTATIRRVYSPPTISCPEPSWMTIYDWAQKCPKCSSTNIKWVARLNNKAFIGALECQDCGQSL